MRPNFTRSRKKERGQVLLLAVLAILVLAIAFLVLFDVQRIMRGKIRVMSGIDAAALTGATWQKHTLNLIGELNLAKACNVLISDSIYGIGGDPDGYMKLNINRDSTQAEIDAAVARAKEELAKLKTAADMLTEMQVRISFVGPLIGFGAAQQAAKQNGLPANRDCNQYMIDFYKLIMDDDIYGNPDLAPQNYYGYSWRMPYAQMIYSLTGSLDPDNANGVAVGTSVKHLGMPRLYSDPPTDPNFIGYLQLKTVLEAIDANDWCLLQKLVDADDSAYVGKWWGNIKIEPNTDFLGGSEILPIHTDHEIGQAVFDFADNAGYIDDAIGRKTGRSDRLVKLNSLYNSTQPVRSNCSINWNDTDLKFNPLPSITWSVFDADHWTAYDQSLTNAWRQYLRGGFREKHDYFSGAISYFSVSVPNSTMIRRYDLPAGFRRSGGRNDPNWNKMQRYSSKASSSIANSTGHNIRFDATAKPFGVLKAKDGSVHYPFAARMVLPVFEKTALIPVALEKPDGMLMEDRAWIIYLTKYLPALGTVDSLDAVKGMMDPDDYNTVNNAGYPGRIRKTMDPDWRAAGRAWLNAEATGHDVYDEYGNFVEHVTDTVNRDHCLDWPGGGGHRTGPGKLH
ncbi:MAG: hypothetical protein IJS14_09260 [Lentisphaeria bacterium]|nr:hypothetical protein [Lentisphaeria bacterium]